MVEIVGLSALHSTKPILDRLEAAGRSHGGIQHWGMFYNMAAPDVRNAFKDLDKWLGIRALLTKGGTIHTFDNVFAERSGLTGLPRAGSLRTAFSDYDGDGKTDFAVWRPTDSNWYVIDSSTKTQTVHPWGQTGDIPVPGDYDGDGKADLAVWRPGTGEWWFINSSDKSQHTQQWGVNGDVPGSARVGTALAPGS